jgi:hypothetical protein
MHYGEPLVEGTLRIWKQIGARDRRRVDFPASDGIARRACHHTIRNEDCDEILYILDPSSEVSTTRESGWVNVLIRWPIV